MRSSTERIFDADRVDEQWRTSCRIDADRVFYSPEFRRLSGVTQVVPPQDGYHFHDRLTHSLKVAQVAETLARQLVYEAMQAKSFPDRVDITEWVDPGFCYVAGLVHDIGHPPFGHAGEKLLQDLWRDITNEELWFGEDNELVEVGGPGDVEGAAFGSLLPHAMRDRSFEGNAQSTRIVCSLSFREESPDEVGMNLTLRSVAAVAKYPWLKGQHPEKHPKLAKKWSFYPEEGPILNRLEEGGFIAVERVDETVIHVWRWPEAEIMDWADDITYAVHDLEDFFRAGLIPLHLVGSALGAAPERVDWQTTDFDFVDDDEIRGCLLFARMKLQKLRNGSGESLERDIGPAFELLKKTLLGSFPKAKFSGMRSSHSQLREFGSSLIKALSAQSKLVWMGDQARVQLQVSPVGILIAEFFKAMNSFFVIESSMLASMQFGQASMLRVLHSALFELSLEWLQNFHSPEVSRRLPARLREYLYSVDFRVDSQKAGEGSASPEATAKYFHGVHVAVMDYICSLRDVQAADLVRQLNGSDGLAVTAGYWLDT